MRNAQICIDVHALSHNLKNIKSRLTPVTKVLAMVKANAYGHGITPALMGLMDADGYGVACLDEALPIVDFLTPADKKDKLIVLIEGVFSEQEWHTAIKLNLSCVIHHQDQLNWALQNKPQPDSHTNTIWLKYNTGMNRLGFDKTAVIDAAKQLSQAGYRLILTSHFACADEKDHPLNQQQIERFNQVYQAILAFAPQTQASLCNSAGTLQFASEHHHWVRAGIALYGSSPIAEQSAQSLGLLPVMHLNSQIIATHQLNAGDSVGYGALWTTDAPHTIGVVGMGYGDGYPRVVKNAHIALQDRHGNWHRRPIIGRVAMDMMMVDIDGLSVGVGSPVQFWGEHIGIDEVATCANTIGYELLCRLTNRPARQIINHQSADFDA